MNTSYTRPPWWKLALARGKLAVNNYVYDGEGYLIYEVNFNRHGSGSNVKSGHGHIPQRGLKGSGHEGEHVPHTEVPPEYQTVPEGIDYATPLGE